MFLYKPLFEQINDYVRSVFASEATKKYFEIMYNESIYEHFAQDICTQTFQPLEGAYTVIAISKIIQDTLSNAAMRQNKISDYLTNQQLYVRDTVKIKSCLKDPAYMNNFITARIDIKNEATSENGIEIIEVTDPDIDISMPAWFNKDNNGKGYVILSKNGLLKIVFRCVKSGKLIIKLRACEVKDENKKKIPFWIDFNLFSVNEEKIFEKIKPVCHNRTYKYTKQVADGEIVTLTAGWQPHQRNILEMLEHCLKK